MDSKLTLRLSKNVIENAKKYAKENKISLSKLVENYLKSLSYKEKEISKASPLVESLTGVISDQSRIQTRDDYYEHLREKYS